MENKIDCSFQKPLNVSNWARRTATHQRSFSAVLMHLIILFTLTRSVMALDVAQKRYSIEGIGYRE